MRRRTLILRALSGAALLSTPGCATMVFGSLDERLRSDKLRWGCLILDLLFMPWLILGGLPIPLPVWLIVDFQTGAIWKPRPGASNRRGPGSRDKKDELFDDDDEALERLEGEEEPAFDDMFELEEELEFEDAEEVEEGPAPEAPAPEEPAPTEASPQEGASLVPVDPLPLCPEGAATLTAPQDRFRSSARAFRGHVQGCGVCLAALVAEPPEGPPVLLRIHERLVERVVAEIDAETAAEAGLAG